MEWTGNGEGGRGRGSNETGKERAGKQGEVATMCEPDLFINASSKSLAPTFLI